MEIIGMLIGIVLLLFVGLAAIVFGVGWLVPTGMGIIRMRRGEGGSWLVAAGVLWGAVAIAGTITLIHIGGTHFARLMPQTFDPADYDGETGEVHLAWNGSCEITIHSTTGGKRWSLKGQDGRVVGPAGDYHLSSWTLKATADDGRIWSARGSSWGQSGPSRVSITPDHPASLEVGPPFRANLHLDATGEKVNISLDIVGSEGASYSIGSPDRKAPGFEVLDASGRVIWSEDFEFG